jgi:ATP-binding cassette subfamily B protein
MTAIIGASGSGKTTLMKLLLKFYDNYCGTIQIGGTDFKNISPRVWRKQCASVLQDGFIFDDTIGRNISLEYIIPQHACEGDLIEACRKAHILSFIESLPRGFNTPLGLGGVGISQGQRQRLLIARAIYRNSDFIFFDEPTNALDFNTEEMIVENLRSFFAGKTVLIIAHRLSTVHNADRIVVMDQGKIIEQGDPIELSRLRGKYFQFINNHSEMTVN